MRLNIEDDKKLHLLAGYAITLTVGILTAIWLGLLLGVLAGLFKEVFDYYKYGGFDNRDLFFTTLGSVFAGMILTLAL